jgi:ATP-binding cassette subfamily F protein 3
MEPEKVEVVYGNYDLYESLRDTREAEESAERKRKAAPAIESKTAVPAGGTTKVKRKRKFPYRKVEELEKEVMEQEELVAELEARMVSPEIYRDANLVKETMADFEDAKERLKTLYEHWEEAVELNG